MLTTLEIIEVIGSSPKTTEFTAIEKAVKSLNEKETEVKKRYACVSDKKIVITIEITLKGITTFQSQKYIEFVDTLEHLRLILEQIDEYFLNELILFALTYKSISAREYQELLHYRKKFGPL